MKKAVLLLAAVSAFAQANQTDVEKKDVSGFYLGGGIGVTTVYDDSVWPYAVNLDSNDSTYKLLVVTSSTVSSQSKRNTHATVIFLTSLKMHHAQW